jgi:hypothetical protein
MFELIKTGNRNVIGLDERRLKAKIILGEYHSVQFNLKPQRTVQSKWKKSVPPI